MPVPVLLGIPLVISAITSFVGIAVTGVVTYIVQKGIIKVLFLAAAIALLTGLVLFLDSQITIVLQQLNSTDWGTLTYSILPTSTSTAISIVLLVDVTKWIYDQSQGLVTKKFS